MANPHKRIVGRAEKAGDYLGTLFNRRGNMDHPNGSGLRAYRAALAGIGGALDSPRRTQALLQQMRQNVYVAVRDVFDSAAGYGVDQAERDLGDWGIRASAYRVSDDYLRSATETTLTALDQQLNAVYTDVLSGSPDEAELLGDESRAGILAPAAVILAATRWLVTIHAGAYSDASTQAIQGAGQQVTEYGKQAVAAIDDKTTDCCLKVHGQLVPVSGAFQLTGTPRFADEMKAPPFHWNCRTATALVKLAEQDDDLTRIMQAAASVEIEARQQGATDAPQYTNAGSVKPSRAGELRRRVFGG